MRTSSGRGFAAWGFLSLIVLTFAGLAAVAGFYPASRVRGAAPLAPRVGAITQITHDGYGKTSVVADDTQVYVSELEAANRVIARVSLPEANRSLFPESSNSQVAVFTNPRAVDLSADHTKLLVSVKDTSGKDASGDNQFWSVPVAGGSPERVGELTGRDASWSANGAQLVLAKGSALYLADAAGTKTHELYKASGSVFAPRFSPDGRAIRFTVTDAEQNTTALWEVGRDGSKDRKSVV